jgi:transposase
MARQATPMKQTRTRHSQAYKDEALALAERIGVRKADLVQQPWARV